MGKEIKNKGKVKVNVKILTCGNNNPNNPNLNNQNLNHHLNNNPPHNYNNPPPHKPPKSKQFSLHKSLVNLMLIKTK
jgi:hypothetical protein